MSNPDKITDDLDDFSDDDSTMYSRHVAEDYDSLDEEEEDDSDDEQQQEQQGQLDKSSQKDKQKKELHEDEQQEDEQQEDVSVVSDEDETRLRKLDHTVRTNIVHKHHPEIVYRNAEEIEKLAQVVRNRQGFIIDPIHRSLPILTKYEKARILGERARQLEEGAQAFVKVPPEIIDSYIIAEMELKEKVIPFILERPLPNGGCEYWRVVDLEII